jgi:hypothetical protein
MTKFVYFYKMSKRFEIDLKNQQNILKRVEQKKKNEKEPKEISFILRSNTT